MILVTQMAIEETQLLYVLTGRRLVTILLEPSNDRLIRRVPV